MGSRVKRLTSREPLERFVQRVQADDVIGVQSRFVEIRLQAALQRLGLFPLPLPTEDQPEADRPRLARYRAVYRVVEGIRPLSPGNPPSPVCQGSHARFEPHHQIVTPDGRVATVLAQCLEWQSPVMVTFDGRRPEFIEAWECDYLRPCQAAYFRKQE